MKVLIDIDDNKGMDSKLSVHFGHCPFFAIYNTKTKKMEIVENKLDHSNPNLTPVDQIMEFKPDIVFSLGMGQRAINLFNENKVKLKTGNFTIVKEVVENINDLDGLNDGCGH